MLLALKMPLLPLVPFSTLVVIMSIWKYFSTTPEAIMTGRKNTARTKVRPKNLRFNSVAKENTAYQNHRSLIKQAGNRCCKVCGIIQIFSESINKVVPSHKFCDKLPRLKSDMLKGKGDSLNKIRQKEQQQPETERNSKQKSGQCVFLSSDIRFPFFLRDNRFKIHSSNLYTLYDPILFPIIDIHNCSVFIHRAIHIFCHLFM